MTISHDQPRLFITGTDTNVGKTHVTCLIARQLLARGTSVAAYKPACSGAIVSTSKSSSDSSNSEMRWDDIERIKTAIGNHWSDDDICPQRFIAPLAPPVAAKREGRTVDFDLLVDGAKRFREVELLLIEGAGGWLSPVTETASVADLAQALHAPVLIVARPGLGTINHTLLTIEAVRSRGLTVVAVVLNATTDGQEDQSCQTNGDEIEARSGVPVLGVVPFQNELELHQQGKPVTINWLSLAIPVPPAVQKQSVTVNPFSFAVADARASNVSDQANWPIFSDPTTPLNRERFKVHSPGRSNHSSRFIVLGTYASLLTIYLIYLIVFANTHQLESLPDLKTVQQEGGRAAVPRPENELPDGHTLRLGQSQRYGDIRVTPQRVTRGSIEFVHFTGNTNQERLPSGPVLKLWLKFENESDQQSIVPIDPTLMFFRRVLKERVASFNAIFRDIDRKDRSAKVYYPFDRLAIDSEWRIVDQPTNEALAPHEALETFVPSEENIDDLSGEVVWRVHFRKGYGRKSGNGVTTLIDVRFHTNQIQPDSA